MFDGEACLDGHATIPLEVANIAKNLIGSGAFSLAGRMAIDSENPEAVWSATLSGLPGWVPFSGFCLLVAKVSLKDGEC